MNIVLEVILLIFLLFLAAVTAASETSLIATSRLRLRRLAADGSRQAKIVLKILEAPAKFFGTILVANNIVGVLIASITTALMISLVGGGGKGILLATVIASFLIIVSEVAAKTLAAQYSEKLSIMLAKPVKALVFILSPLVKVLAIITNFIVRLIGAKKKPGSMLVTEEDIRAMIKIGQEEGSIQKEKYMMLSKVFDFSNTLVRNVMTPKDKIVSINIDAHPDDIIDKVLESGYSRFPVYKDNPNNIIGIVNMKDMLNIHANRGLVVLHDIIYPPVSVPSAKKVTELLKEFQKGHTHLAIVADSDGKMEGLVTLEDLLEEIVGEIEDEHDVR